MCIYNLEHRKISSQKTSIYPPLVSKIVFKKEKNMHIETEKCGAEKVVLICLDGVRSGLGQVLDNATQLGVVRYVVFVPKGSCRREDAEVELLSQVCILPHL